MQNKAEEIINWGSDFDHLNRKWTEGPFPIWEELRKGCPVAHTDRYGGVYLPVRYKDVVEASYDHKRFSSHTIVVRNVPLLKPFHAPPMNALGEQHRSSRKRLMPAFTKPKVETYNAFIGDIAAKLAESCAGETSVDVASRYAFQLSARSVMRVVGAPEEDHQLIAGWTKKVLIFGLGDAAVVAQASDDMAAYCGKLALKRFAEPADDIASLLVQDWDGQDQNGFAEVAVTLRLLLLAGIDTTSSVLAGALWHLAKVPADRQRLIQDVQLMPSAVDEFLRFFAPTTMARLITEDTNLGGTALRARQLLMLPFPAANRDPDVFPEPDRLDLQRSPNKHLAFGIGIHRCIGDHLAKQIIDTGLRTWLANYPDFSLASDKVEWSVGTIRGITKLDVRPGKEVAPRKSNAPGANASASRNGQNPGKATPVLTRQAAEMFNRAKTAQKAKRWDEARRGFRSVLQKHPKHGETLLCLGAIALNEGMDAAAQAYFSQAAAALPNDFRPLHNLANLALQKSKLGQARAFAEAAARLAPDNPAAQHAFVATSIALGRSSEGLLKADAASDLKRDDNELFSSKVLLKRQVCDWRNFYDDEAQLREAAAKNYPVPPLLLLSTEASNEEQSICARRWAQNVEKPLSQHLPARRPGTNCPTRIGYLSGDFHDHATSRLVAELFENHDRQRVAVYGYSYGPDKQSAMRDRMVRSFDTFRDVKNGSSKAIAEKIHSDAIDILVDMKGYTSRARTEILSWRPAPIQVNYLGFPCTMEANFIDYVITDRVVSPPEYQVHSSETFAYLPHCFQPNDTRRSIPDGSITRARYGIPDEAFVFCCFNAAYKLTPKVFAVWMRILQAVPDSLLYLLVRSQEQVDHLRREAKARGVDPRRLSFARHVDMNEHLARCALADLFLDTLPVSAFTTASDALWAGLPVLTCAGPTPAGRGSASLLHAMGVPELVAYDMESYEALAIQLARDPKRLLHLRRCIERARLGMPPFDTRGLAQDLEELYRTMVAAWPTKTLAAKLA